MIISEFIEVKTFDNKKLKHYKSLGYDISVSIINVRVEDLPKSVSNLILVKCDYCDYVGHRHYVDYNRTLKNNRWACSKECGFKRKLETESNKVKKKHPNFGKKIPKDVLDSILEKRKKTNLEKWGVEHILQNKEIKEKFKKTNIERFNVENFSQSENFLELLKKTNLEKWGVDFPTQSSTIKDKIKKTNLERWGVSSTLQLQISKDRRLEKTNSSEYRKKFEISNNENYIDYLGSSISLFKCDLGETHSFEIRYDNFKSRKNLGLPICTICYPINNFTSIKEKEVLEFIKNEYSGEIITSYRDGLEIDIYLPELKLGFEFNGVWWHSDVYKEKEYHLNKINHFKERNVRIVHIWEDDWDFRKNIIKSQILNLIGKSLKIHARKCYVKEVIDVKLVKKFLNENHIQGYVSSIIKIGLFYNNELISIMTFDKFEGRKKMIGDEWNLNRFCNKLGISVVGGASKLLSYFKKFYIPNRIISYSDNNWSNGDLYRKIGFCLYSEIKPDYKYIVDGVRVHKSGFRKSKTNISESNLKIPKLWDSGKIKWEKKF